MELGNFDKGSIIFDSMAKSLRQRYFSAKTQKHYDLGMPHRLVIQNETLCNEVVS